ncbi:hypothetical protein OHB00_44590 [Streptomyces sp. NBC_00631]|uniref:hypothetical protein n=1 Tax=Streptomyces sp. NBC_00631 TaxID=2975793 RepID=UPI0030E598C7
MRNTLTFRRPALLAAALLGATAALAGAPTAHATTSTSAATVKPAINQVTCGSRTDWLRLWTEYHGYPVCYANNGTITYGFNPPVNTWTSYGICFGNNSGTVTYYVDGAWTTKSYGSGDCDNWSSRYGTTVEVGRIAITGR